MLYSPPPLKGNLPLVSGMPSFKVKESVEEWIRTLRPLVSIRYKHTAVMQQPAQECPSDNEAVYGSEMTLSSSSNESGDLCAMGLIKPDALHLPFDEGGSRAPVPYHGFQGNFFLELTDTPHTAYQSGRNSHIDDCSKSES